jgi:hypothetical protein
LWRVIGVSPELRGGSELTRLNVWSGVLDLTVEGDS